jgi:hypothetical protein
VNEFANVQMVRAIINGTEKVKILILGTVLVDGLLLAQNAE